MKLVKFENESCKFTISIVINEHLPKGILARISWHPCEKLWKAFNLEDFNDLLESRAIFGVNFSSVFNRN